MASWHKKQLYIERLARQISRPTRGPQRTFFLPRFSSGFHIPASSRIRRTLFGLTSATQLLALASSSLDFGQNDVSC
jgi:hypothetical protein